MDSKLWTKANSSDRLITKDIDLNEYKYNLPDNKIAQQPVEERDMSKLLVSGGNIISETRFRNLDEFIPAGHLLVFNNSRVVRARILFRKDSGALVELFCLEPLVPADYERSFSAKRSVVWRCMVGNLKKWKTGKLIRDFVYNGTAYELTAEKINQHDNACEIVFSWNCNEITFAEILEITGRIPLPPYINREERIEDICRYQTIYAQVKGSVAAPTAGLHFTDLVFEKLRSKGVLTAEVTLHVGAGTFQPVKTENILNHEMHCEHFSIASETLEKIIENNGRIIAVGTTSVRTLESLYWIGAKLFKDGHDGNQEFTLGQWEPYDNDNTPHPADALRSILNLMSRKSVSSLTASTSIMIIPGYEFKIISGMITNFHQPGSTLLLLVSAWTGNKWKNIYRYALENNFRFLSYGDSSILFR